MCEIVGTIHLTAQLVMMSSGVTLRGGAITNVPEYPNGLVMVAKTGDVRLEGVTIYGTLALSTSSVKDCLLILDSTRVTLDHVTLLYCEDENVDITGSTKVEIYNSVVMQPLRCAMHRKGCHDKAALIVNSDVTIKDTVFGSAGDVCRSARIRGASFSMWSSTISTAVAYRRPVEVWSQWSV